MITGSSRGLGRCLAETFIKKGYAVAVNYLHSQADAEEIVSAAGGSAAAIQGNVGRASEAVATVNRVEERFGRLDLLINNAGITRDSLLIRQSEADWDSVIRTNLTGCFNMIKAAAPLMIRSGGGHIINVSSFSGRRGKTGQAAYSASKAGIIGLTISAAQELAEHNIRVNAVLPGYMLTDMGTAAPSAQRLAEEESAMGILAEPSAVADSVAALAEMDYITGQIIGLDSRMI